MAGDAANSASIWGSCEQYDWRSWRSWRAVFASAAVIGLIAAVAGLIADSLVRDLLGMNLGHPGYFSGPDLLAVALAWGVAIPGLIVWHRMLKNPKAGASDCPTRPSSLSGSRRFRLEISLLLCWLGSATAVFLLLHAGINSILADREAGRLTFVILPALLTLNFKSLGPVFGSFGAKPLPANPIG